METYAIGFQFTDTVRIFCDSWLVDLPNIFGQANLILCTKFHLMERGIRVYILVVQFSLEDSCKQLLEQLQKFPNLFNTIFVFHSIEVSPSLIHYCATVKSPESIELLDYILQVTKYSPNPTKE